jgi:hypothetical protein
MISPLGIEIEVGQIWEELYKEPPYRRVEVVGFGRDDTVRIKRGRVREAQLRRFNGKRGGYQLVGD